MEKVFARDWFSSRLSVCSSPHLAKPLSVICKQPKNSAQMKIVHILVILLILFSCSNSENTSNSNEYFYGYFGNSKNNQNEHLTIKTRFDECGEWGGHFEKIIIFNKNDSRKLYAKYEETNYDCSNGNQNPKIVKTNEVEVKEIEKKEIKNYLKKLIEFKSNSFVTGNSGMSYSAVSQDSTLIIYTYNNDEECKRAFKKLKFNLHL